MLVVCAKYLSTATMSSPSSVWCLVFCGFDGKENKQELYKTYQNQFGDTSNIYEEYIYIYIYIYEMDNVTCINPFVTKTEEFPPCISPN